MPQVNKFLVTGGDFSILISHENGIEGCLLLSVEDPVLKLYFFLRPLAQSLADKIVQCKADILGHFGQQVARRFVEGVDLAGIQRESTNGAPFIVQRQRRRSGKTCSRSTLLPEDD